MISHSLFSCRCQRTRAPQWTPTHLSSELWRGEALRTTSRSLNMTFRRTRGGSLPETGGSRLLSACPQTPSFNTSISEHIRKVGWRFIKCTDVRVNLEKYGRKTITCKCSDIFKQMMSLLPPRGRVYNNWCLHTVPVWQTLALHPLLLSVNTAIIWLTGCIILEDNNKITAQCPAVWLYLSC